jgi:hypothetical protein
MQDLEGRVADQKRKGFWEKLKENAAEILERDIIALRKKTIDPEFCLLPRDQLLMMARQDELSWLQHRRKALDRDGTRANLTALGVVLESKPLLLLRLAS